MSAPIHHWTPQRKAALIRAVRSGGLVLESTLVEYSISPEEYAAWERDYDRRGVAGLAVTKQGGAPTVSGKWLTMIAAALAVGVSTAAAAQTENLCRDPEVAGDLIKAFNHIKWEDGRRVVDIEHLVTIANKNGKSCHGIWDLEDARQIEGTLTLRLNVAGDPMIHWQEETLLAAKETYDGSDPSYRSALAAAQQAMSPAGTPTSSSFSDGAHDRIGWETWFNGLAGEEHDGAYFWAAQRSLPVPANCTRLGGDGTLGCLEAKKRLDPSDARRKSDPEYRAGWNSIHAN